MHQIDRVIGMRPFASVAHQTYGFRSFCREHEEYSNKREIDLAVSCYSGSSCNQEYRQDHLGVWKMLQGY